MAQSNTEYRIEHDTMGEVRVPAKRAVARADPAGRGELPDLVPAAGAHPDPRARPAQGRLRAGQQGPRPARRREGRRDHRRRRRDRRRQARRPVPHRRLPDRFGHQLEHERQRGHRHASRGQRRDRAPQRRRQHVAELQRHLPDGHPHRRHRSRCAPSDSGAGGAARVAGRQGPPVAHRRQVRPHAPDGRRAGDARPGVRRLRPPGRGGHRAGARRRCPGSASWPSAAPPSAPASTPPTGSAPRSSTCW